jgi:hypothetical protein
MRRLTTRRTILRTREACNSAASILAVRAVRGRTETDLGANVNRAKHRAIDFVAGPTPRAHAETPATATRRRRAGRGRIEASGIGQAPAR